MGRQLGLMLYDTYFCWEKNMSRENAIARAAAIFDDGHFFDLLSRWISHPTESQNETCKDPLRTYLSGAITPYLENMGFSCRLVDNPVNSRLPFLISQRMEGENLPTVLTYGHGDTVLAMDGRWREGLEPWQVIQEGERWYGRGAADNKGQHAINLAALKKPKKYAKHKVISPRDLNKTPFFSTHRKAC
jgi:acetylornithine deacetylase/succinyl-diaminopimelate desuccinylase-like protein